MNLSMRLKAMMAQDAELVKRIQLVQAKADFEAALQRYASLLDKINGKEDGTTLKLIEKVLKEDAGLPIHNIPSDFHAREIQAALAQLEAAVNQSFEIHEDEIILFKKQVEAYKKSCRKLNNQNHHIVKIICRPTSGHQHQSAWKRTRSNPKLR